MKNKISKKEIRTKISNSLSQTITELEGSDPSKKIKKTVKRASKKIANKVSRELKDLAKGKKSKEKAIKAASNGQKKKEAAESIA